MSYQNQGPPQPPPQGNGSPQGLPPYVWMFEVKAGVWQPVAPRDNETIEQAYTANQNGSATVDLYGPNTQAVSYKLDFPTLSRLNVATGSDRKMRRVTGQELIALPPQSVIPPPTAPQPTAADVPVEVQWIFDPEEQNQPPLPLKPEDSQKLEACFKGDKAPITLSLGELGEHTVDVANFKRTTPGGNTTNVVRIDPTSLPPIMPAPPGLQWFFQDDRKCWMAFAPEDSEMIEEKYNACPMVTVEMRGIKYDLNFTTWTRKNTATGSERQIRRVLDGKENPVI